MRALPYVALGLLLALAGPAAAEVVRLEVVGVSPAGEDAPRDMSVRERALRSALEEGVQRVARDLLTEPTDPEALEAALGDPRSYAVSYRILEDRGERRALLLRGSDVATEYILLVEVQVDTTRVERTLVKAGLRERSRGPARRFRIQLEEVPSYTAYQQLRQGLLGAGARRAVPLAFEPGRVLLEVDAPTGPDRILQRLVEAGRRDGLEIRVLDVQGSEVRLRVVESGVSSSSRAPAGRR